VTPPDRPGTTGPGDLIDSRLSDALERVGHVLRTQLRAAGAEHGLSPIQAQLLMRIATVGQPDREPARLAGWFDLSRPTVSDATAALRRKNLLTHEPVPDDRRRTRLVLTPSGRKVARQLARWDEPVRAQFATLPPTAKGDTVALLLGLIGRMQRSGLVSVARTCVTCRFYRPRDEPTSAGHCTFLDVPLPPEALRLDCPDHDPAA
jgi:DNA-binding MarR family transcriptional regulator